MSGVKISPLHPGVKEGFYSLLHEYLPDIDPGRVYSLAEEYPAAYLALTVDDQVIGAAYGWPRRLFVPEDPSFTLDGIVVHWDYQRRGYGRQLLCALENAAKMYGCPAVSVGSAGGYAEDFYLGCGYFPKEYKYYQDGRILVEHVFQDTEDYRTYRRIHPEGFVVFEKNI